MACGGVGVRAARVSVGGRGCLQAAQSGRGELDRRGRSDAEEAAARALSFLALDDDSGSRSRRPLCDGLH